VNGFRPCLTAALVLMSGMANVRAGATADAIKLNGEDLKITVHVFNSARIPRYELAQAEREATSILAETGVKVIWEHCATSVRETPSEHPCAALYDLTHLFLDIELWQMVKRLGLNGDMLGACTAKTDGRPHNQALVSYNRVEFIAFQWQVDRGLILGAAVAHEIGHLLLEQTSHSTVGIMRPDFSKEDFRPYNRRHLRFTDDQARAMQGEVLARFNASKSFHMQ
jgi:hypothetical protein